MSHEPERRRFSYSFEEGEPPAIRVHIYNPNIRAVEDYFHECKRLPAMLEEWGFARFVSDPARGFGFDGVVEAAVREAGYVVVRIPLQPHSYAAAASAALLFEALNESPGQSSHPSHLQLMQVTSWIGYEKEALVLPLDGTYAPALAERLVQTRQTGQVLDEVIGAMRAAWRATSEKPPSVAHVEVGFTAQAFEDGNFELRCPDQVLAVTQHAQEIWTRNVATIQHQLTLLAGLAALCGLASKELD